MGRPAPQQLLAMVAARLDAAGTAAWLSSSEVSSWVDICLTDALTEVVALFRGADDDRPREASTRILASEAKRLVSSRTSGWGLVSNDSQAVIRRSSTSPPKGRALDPGTGMR